MLNQKALASMKSFRNFLAVLIKDFYDLKTSKFDQNSFDLIMELRKMLASINESQILITFSILELNQEQPDSLSAESLISTLKKLEHYINFQDQQVFVSSTLYFYF